MTVHPTPSLGPDVRAEDFLAGCRADIQSARRLIEAMKSKAGPKDLSLLETYDDAMALLGNAASRSSLCRNAHPSQALRDAAETCEQEIDAVVTRVSLDPEIYRALREVPAEGLDPATSHYLTRTLRDFRRAGVDRDEKTREKIRALKEDLVRIGQEFGKNIIEDVRTLFVEPQSMEGLPADFRKAHPPGKDGKVQLTTDNTDYVPFITYSKDDKAREAIWRLYRLRAHPKNLDALDRMLSSRHELAGLLGYPSWADYATEDKMIGSRQAAADFIEKIASASQARAKREYEQLLTRKKEDQPGAEHVDAWDSSYYQERIKSERYGFDSQAIRPYFEYGRVKQGVLDVTSEMFGISYRRVEEKAWHAEVEIYDVVEGGRPLGRIYLDMHPREGKYKHYAQFTLVSGQRDRALPQGVLLCNFPRPKPEAPALLEHGDVKTFFHEFGHLLHHVLGGHTRWVGISGVATEWDFVEAPSQMLEEWVWDPATLRRFAKHVDTGEPIPDPLVAKAKAASEYGKGLSVRQQMFYAALSLGYHDRDPSGLDTTALMAKLQSRYTPFRYVEGTYFHESFGHLDGYSAIYYTYMWSLVIAKDLFTVFKERGMLDPQAAQRYRKAVLEPGGARPAAQLVESFLGRPYSYRAFEEWLNA